MNHNNNKLDNNTKTGSVYTEFTGCVGLPEPVINTRPASQVADIPSNSVIEITKEYNPIEAILKASRDGNIHVVIELLDKQTFDKNTLHNCAWEAIYSNRNDIVRLLLDRSIISIDTKLWGRSTLLHLATD